MGADELVRARDRMIAAVRDDLPLGEMLMELTRALHDLASFEHCAVILTDPETMLPSAGAVEGFGPDACVPFWDNELLDPDFLKFNALARSSEPIGTLFEATDGDLARSPRYQKLYEHLGVADELRVAFTSGNTCWAASCLVRAAAEGPFTAGEIHDVREFVPAAVRALRHATGRRHCGLTPTGPAMMVVDGNGEVESMTADAEAMLADLRTRGLAEPTPACVLAVARRAKMSRSSTRIAMRARGASGQWLKLHASPLGDDGRVAVMIEPARATDLVPILLESYGVTGRETEVVFLLARGLSTKEIAAELCISVHTVNDHIKVIFAKTGVSSRGELVARLFANHLFEEYHDSVTYVTS